MAELPLAPVERIMRNSGAERISVDAVKRAADEAERLIYNLTQRAGSIARSEGRSTITPRDIALASKTVAAEPHP